MLHRYIQIIATVFTFSTKYSQHNSLYTIIVSVSRESHNETDKAPKRIDVHTLLPSGDRRD